MHITSLPSRGGIGTMGKTAYDFIDFVKASGMSIWQMLPIGPTGYADSPYQSASTYAGNPLMIDLDILEQQGILPAGSYEPMEILPRVDYEAVKAQKRAMLKLAFAHSFEKLTAEIAAFEQKKPWVRDFALFYAVKEHFNSCSWMQWPDEDIRLRKPERIQYYSELLSEEINYFVFEQYLFFGQWEAMHDYARANGIRLMGDIPIYVAEDSCDVWLNPDMFELDEDCRPIRIAGVPPDYFQADGQRWGNPLYKWDAHARTQYRWWVERLKAVGSLFDIIRIDHFIGFANYYAIPAEEQTARNGKYEAGPGRKLFERIRKELPDLKIVAEDLGNVSQKVKNLLKWSGYPGMKVMQFAFDDGGDNTHLPKKHPENCVVYTGTHDNPTSLGWWSTASEETKAFARRTLKMPKNSDDIVPALIKGAFESRANTVIVPMQDWLGLGNECRMNFPGVPSGNWQWRMQPTDLAPLCRRIRALNKATGRYNVETLSGAEIIRKASDIIAGRHHTTLEKATPVQLHDAIAHAAMIEIAPQWAVDNEDRMHGRHALYLSAEYLMGRLVYNNLYSMGVLNEVKAELAKRGVSLADLEEIEDAALGNGGLGRLAACFLDSAASHDIPLDGYGLRYKYGLFKQTFEDFAQHEEPDDWTKYGDPWSIRRDDLTVIVPMKNLPVRAVPYDMPVIGYNRKSIGTLRLWQCESTHEFDFELFNSQHYVKAAKDKNTAEDITKLLYPNDSMKPGKLMRIRQQYVLSSASLQDMLRTYKAVHGDDLSKFHTVHAIQLNDTHPVMAIPELIRLLMAEGMAFEPAFKVAQKTFRYTNHTVMREALECWDISLLNEVAPEMVQVIKKIHNRLMKDLKKAGVENTEPLEIINNNYVRMANIAVYATSFTNGVAAIHTQILKDSVFKEWFALYPERFNNKTNGITQRRWLGLCNPELSALITEKIGDGFLTDLYELENLRPLIDDELAQRFIAVKREKKRQLAAIIKEREGVEIPEHFVFDVQIKRMHEYKRQLLNAFSVLDIYYGLKEGSITDFQPTAFIFGAKSAPGYARSKAVIRFINRIAAMVNADPDVNDKMRVVFVHNYNCSYAEHIIPAADLSEQISPAGTEASGTGNMKLMLNGACTLGTYDGANVEIFEQAGVENNFVFGATVEEINAIRDTYWAQDIYNSNPRIRRVVDALGNGMFEPADAPMMEGTLVELKKSLLEGAHWHRPDHYFLLKDFDSYIETKLRAIRDTRDEIAFAKKCLYNIAGAGKFSSDRTIQQYWDELWA